MTWLVIGIGNVLRRDDGVGPWLAERVAQLRLPDVTTMAVHQLTPELAAAVARHDRILFIDASVAAADEPIAIAPADDGERWGHALSPGAVMALAGCLNSESRQAWLVPVPGSDFDFGETISAAAQARAERALLSIAAMLHGAPTSARSL